MAINYDQTAVLRSYLTGDFEGHERLLGQLDSDTARTGYVELVGAAFFLAARQWFSGDVAFTDVIRFVGKVRSQSEEIGRTIDPVTAERLLSAASTDQNLDDLDGDTVLTTQLLLLLALTAEARLGETWLDELLAAASALVESLGAAAPP